MHNKILIIEEDIFLSDLLVDRLKREGYEVKAISNAAVAVDQMLMFKPDMVIIDTLLKSSTVPKVLLAKNALADLVKTPVLALSPAGSLSEIKSIVALGVSDYIVKSQLNFSDLVAKIKKNLATKHMNNNGLAGVKVMWVEDDQFLSDLISRKLSSQGANLLFSHTAEDALKVLEKERPDIILLDVLLPGMSGFDLLEKINQNKELAAIPKIFLSNFSEQEHLDRAKKLGSKRYLVKATIVLDDLVKEIKDVLEEGKRVV
jgi:DNA-binding response OmpR family regulator